MREKLLTVNVVTYNHAKYIEECLDSILMQETDFDFTVRIFDDASTDGTQDICRKYKEKYPDKIELFLAEKNLGLNENGVLNNPLRSYENIDTPYYLYIEGDDKRLNKFGFQKQVDALEAHPECSFCASRTCNDYNMHGYPSIEQKIYSKEFVVNNYKYYYYVALLSRIVRTNCISFDEKYQNAYLVDISQMFELLKKGSMYFIDEIFGYYRYTGEGAVTKMKFFDRVFQNASQLKKYNDYTNDEFSNNLALIFNQENNWSFSNILNEKCKKHPLRSEESIFKKIKHYILPPILIDFLNLPRDFSRFLKRQKLAKKNKKQIKKG